MSSSLPSSTASASSPAFCSSRPSAAAGTPPASPSSKSNPNAATSSPPDLGALADTLSFRPERADAFSARSLLRTRRLAQCRNLSSIDPRSCTLRRRFSLLSLSQTRHNPLCASAGPRQRNQHETSGNLTFSAKVLHWGPHILQAAGIATPVLNEGTARRARLQLPRGEQASCWSNFPRL